MGTVSVWLTPVDPTCWPTVIVSGVVLPPLELPPQATREPANIITAASVAVPHVTRRRKASTIPDKHTRLHNTGKLLCNDAAEAGGVTETVIFSRGLPVFKAKNPDGFVVHMVPDGPPVHWTWANALIGVFNPSPAKDQTVNVAVCPRLTVIVAGAPGSRTTAKSLFGMFIPVPVSWTVCGLPGALSVLMNCPALVPAADGLNCRPPVTLDAAATVTGFTRLVTGSKLNSEELKLKVAGKGAVPELLICNG
jgi:hypothetical protein